LGAFWRFAPKPGYPLQSFLPRCGKKGFPLLSLAHGRQAVLFHQHGASPTACLYGLKANRDQPDGKKKADSGRAKD
jgi:hypothetical protein